MQQAEPPTATVPPSRYDKLALLKVRAGKGRDLQQALRIREIVFAALDGSEVGSREIVTLTRAWCDVQERLRILRGKPLPGQLRPDDPRAAKRRRRQTGPLDLGPVDAGPSSEPSDHKPD